MFRGCLVCLLPLQNLCRSLARKPRQHTAVSHQNHPVTDSQALDTGETMLSVSSALDVVALYRLSLLNEGQVWCLHIKDKRHVFILVSRNWKDASKWFCFDYSLYVRYNTFYFLYLLYIQTKQHFIPSRWLCSLSVCSVHLSIFSLCSISCHPIWPNVAQCLTVKRIRHHWAPIHCTCLQIGYFHSIFSLISCFLCISIKLTYVCGCT